jgi:hypothetical protein
MAIRGRGRPVAVNPFTARVTVPMSRETKDRLVEAAAANNTSVSEYIRQLFQKQSRQEQPAAA